MAPDLSEAGAQAASLALKMGSTAADTITFVAGLGEEIPVIKPVLKTLTAIREKVETVRSNREELAALQERCTYITACFIVKCRRNPSSELDIAPIEGCVEAALKFVDRCSQRGKVSRVLKASSDKDEIAALNARVDRVTSGLGLAGVAVLEGKADDMKAMLHEVLARLDKAPAKRAPVPKGTPGRKSWHVERRHVMDKVFEALARGTGPQLVGLVGHSGSGKTTAASEIVRSAEVREAFSDGIVWLTVNDAARDRLSSLMLQLARMMYEDIGGSVGQAPSESDNAVAYIKQRMVGGQGGRCSKCLVVADNVWEKEVVSMLQETGAWLLLSTRDEALVTDLGGEAVGVDELSAADAESVLRRAAELAPEVRLPDDAVALIELCGRVAMDLAFVGRWSTVRGRQDQGAWAAAAEKVRSELGKLGGNRADEATAGSIRTNRRKAILRAGFEDLAIGSDNEHVPRLYLSLAVLPEGHSFSVRDAAVLLYDRAPSADDEVSARGVVECLERWSVLRSPYFAENCYFMHDAHSGFAREHLMDHGSMRRSALERWTKYLSSLDTLRCESSWTLKGYWLAVKEVGGDSWEDTCPYAGALAGMDDSDPLLWKTMQGVAEFQRTMEDWEGASTTCRRMLKVGKTEGAQEYVEEFNLAGLASGFREARRLEEAEGLLKLLLGIQEAKLGPDDMQVAYTLHSLGVCVREAGRLEEAEGFLRRSLRIKEATLSPDDVQVAYTLHQLGLCVREAGRLEEAEGLLRRSLRIKEATLSPDDVQVAYTLHQLGSAMDRGRLNTSTLDRVSRLASTAGDAASIQISIDAIQWDISLVDKDVRRLVEVTQSKTKQTYAGTSNETPQGRAFLKKQLDVLMKEKAQYKEKKQALLMLQENLEDNNLPGIKEDSPEETPSTSSPSELEDQKAVAATTIVWKETVTSGTYDAPKKTAALYAEDGVLWGTVSEEVRDTPEQIYAYFETVTSGTYDAPKKTAALYAEDGVLWGTVSEEVRDTPEQIYAYFDYFARLPELRVVEYTPVAVRVYGDFAIQAGTYTFAFQGADGATVEKRARFSFTFRRDNPGSPQPWTIVEHHSSSMPTAPAGLKRVGPNADIVKVTPKKVEITADQLAVAATTIVWKETVTEGKDDTPRKTADLYAKDAVLWGTVSEEVRETPEQIYDYFDFFARLPKLRVVEYTPAPVRVYGQFAVEAGTYTFAWQGEDGKTVEKRARFSFTFRREKPGSAQPWIIVEHHSSSMPNAPAELKSVEMEADVDSIAQSVSEVSVAAPAPAPASSASKGVGTIFRALFGGGESKDDKKEAPEATPAAATRDLPAAGIKTGDILYKLGGVPLGSYKEGLALFRNKTGPVVITCVRQGDVTI
eukprot:g3250.t1